MFHPVGFLRHKQKAFALREAYCADPRRVSLPSDLLMPERLMMFDGDPSPVRSGGGDTSTLVVIDANGQTVSWVQSLFDEFGSGIACPEHGIVLHNRAALERLDDDPVHGLKGGHRPFHTLCPALVTGSEGETMALATPGDHGQPQTLAQILRRCFEQRLDVQAAIEWPRLRHDFGDEVMLEDRYPASWDAALTEAGWRVRRVGPWSRLMGGANAILRRPDGLLMAGADPRRSSYALPV
jgi:gamma-glutamyltranspeptidase/glutathione hydrolase